MIQWQTMNSSSSTRDLLQLADACVVCGLCVPHCPTYRKTGLEADGPRGRIQLMRAVLREELPASPRFHEHIDACLSCRNCEAVCPNHVRYGELIDGVRSRYPASQRRPRWFDRPLKLMARHPRLWTVLRLLLAPLQRLGLSPLLRRNGLARLPLSAARPVRAAAQERVALFLGCVSRLADVPALQAAIKLLEAAGVGVDIPAAQGCCGALAVHQGDQQEARAQAAANAHAFAGSTRVLFNASGCGATLLDYTSLGISAFPAMDVLAFLAQLPAERLRFRPLPQTVWLHAPCSQRNVVRSLGATEQLLLRIPGLDLRWLPGNDQCCGAAGRYHLDQPQMADQLRNDKMAAIRDAGASILLSSNIGCVLWLRAALPHLRLMHPLELLSEQLES